MAKKYLSLEEAADILGLSTKDLIELRERQEIRGYADRGTWKFKEEDVAEFRRSRQADSNPDVPILGDDGLGEQPTVIRRGGSALDDLDEPSRGRSDSDVRLIVDDDLASAYVDPAQSDSDVRLIDDSRIGKRRGSDSDVKIVSSVADSDSDVRLAASLADSDSDVRMAPKAPAAKGSDSDVGLAGNPRSTRAMTRPKTDSDVKLLKKPGPHDTESEVSVVPMPPASKGKGAAKPPSASVLADDADIELDSGMTLKAGSGIALERLADSGISLEAGDSGIMLFSDDDDDEAPGSGIHLSRSPGLGGGSSIGRGRSNAPSSIDSGLTLAESDEGLVLDEESGIGLASPGDSGIALSSPIDSGISLEADDRTRDELNSTVPMMGRLGGDDDDLDSTGLEIPNMADEGSGYELKMPTGDSSGEVADTSVILFDDEDDAGEGATRIRSSREADDEEFGGESFDMEEAGEEASEFEDDLDVADDVEGEDDELDDMNVFAEDEDFDDESFSSGESVARPLAGRAPAFEAPVQQEWGVGTFITLTVSTAILSLCGLVMFDLVRSMWNWNEPGAVTGAIIEQVKGLF